MNKKPSVPSPDLPQINLILSLRIGVEQEFLEYYSKVYMQVQEIYYSRLASIYLLQ